MEEGYSSIEDILAEVAEEEGLTLDEMEELWSHQKSYIAHLMDKKDVYAIFYPYIGTLSLNVKQFKVEHRVKNSDKYSDSDILKKIEALKSEDNFGKLSTHNKVLALNSLANYIIKNYETGLEESSSTLTLKKCWDIVSKYSNNIYPKKKNDKN